MEETISVERQSMKVDIACVGFGPASAGFLTTLSRAMEAESGQGMFESRVMPGMPLQVVCYERADDIGFGVSGVVTRARGIRASFPDLDPSLIPMAHPVTGEKLVYLADPIGASRRPAALKAADAVLGIFRGSSALRAHAMESPFIPGFLSKEDGLVLSLGQFNQWVGSQLMAAGQVQIWPGMPVAEPLLDGNRVAGIRLADQGTDAAGRPEAGYMPGMDIRASLTVVGDGPLGPVGRKLDERFGLPPGHTRDDWAVGMKMVIELPPDCTLEAGTVLHTFGFPEPEIFGFLYVYPGGMASAGIFVPSWFYSPIRTTYRYLQHWMQHPYLWRHLRGGTMRSWGAKSLMESGRNGEPFLAGDGYARIGEGSGSTNMLTGSGVDEAWTTGVQLAEGVIELLRAGRPFTRDNLEETYVARRRRSWVEREAREAERARDGFRRGVVTGLLGMGLTGLTGGRLNLKTAPVRPGDRIPSLAAYYRGRVPKETVDQIRRESTAAGTALHDALMEADGWPRIEMDGKLLVSQQDALLMGGKVQAPGGYADHVIFRNPAVCERCESQLCVEVCSGQAITRSEHGGVPQFDREKCVHCGACVWNCTASSDGELGESNIEFRAGAGGLHSAEN